MKNLPIERLIYNKQSAYLKSALFFNILCKVKILAFLYILCYNRDKRKLGSNFQSDFQACNEA